MNGFFKARTCYQHLADEPERTAYVVSKTGVIGLTKQLAIEFGDADIRANSISPGVTRTNMT